MTTAPLGADVLAHRDWLLSLLPAPAGGVVVDLGCGTGRDLLALAERHPRGDARFLSDLEARSRAGRYFYAITGYAFVGRREGARTPWTGGP